MFQHYILVKVPLDQCEITTRWRVFQIQDKSKHGLVKLTYSGDNCWCLFCVHMTQLDDIDDDYEYQATIYLSSWTRVCGSLNTAIHQQVAPFIANCNMQKISTIVMTWIIVVISSCIWAELPRVFIARKFNISRLCFYLQLFSRGGFGCHQGCRQHWFSLVKYLASILFTANATQQHSPSWQKSWPNARLQSIIKSF